MISLSSLRAWAEAKFQVVCHLKLGVTALVPGKPVTAPGLAVPVEVWGAAAPPFIGPSIAGSAAGAEWERRATPPSAIRHDTAAAIRGRGVRWFIEGGLIRCRRSDGQWRARVPAPTRILRCHP